EDLATLAFFLPAVHQFESTIVDPTWTDSFVDFYDLRRASSCLVLNGGLVETSISTQGSTGIVHRLIYGLGVRTSCPSWNIMTLVDQHTSVFFYSVCIRGSRTDTH